MSTPSSQPSRHCVSCGARLRGPFCSECGAAANRPPGAPERAIWPYMLVVALLLALVGTIVMTSRRAAAPPTVTGAASVATPPGVGLATPGAAGLDAAPGSAPVDLSTLTPVERFDRHFDRVMRADEGGDTSTVTTFAPMALAAFEMLDSPDADARFHAGLIRIATGDFTGAAALAATIAAEQPTHLFGILLKGRIAEQQQNQTALAAARREFLAAYPAESAAERPEYPGHQVIIDRFLQESSR